MTTTISVTNALTRPTCPRCDGDCACGVLSRWEIDAYEREARAVLREVEPWHAALERDESTCTLEDGGVRGWCQGLGADSDDAAPGHPASWRAMQRAHDAVIAATDREWATERAAIVAVERLMGEALPRVGRWTQTKAEGVYGEVWTLDGELCDVRPEPDGTWWSWRHQFSGATGSCATRDEAMTMGERVTEALKGVLR